MRWPRLSPLLVGTLAKSWRCLAGFWDFASRHTVLFDQAALRHLRTPNAFPPSIAVVDPRTSRFENCVEEGTIYALEATVPRIMKDFARMADNASTDFVLAPHCLANKLSAIVEPCMRQGLHRRSSGVRPCEKQGLQQLAPHFRSWSGEMRRFGPRVLVVLTFASGRLMAPGFDKIPHVAAYIGPTSWLQRNVFSKTRKRRRQGYGCPVGRSTVGDGMRNFAYPDQWGQQDVVVHPPSPYLFTSDWRPAVGRDILFSFAGGNHSCIRSKLLRMWGKTVHTHVVDTESRGDEILHVKGAGNRDYASVLQRSRYCLVPDGHVPWSYRFLDALHFGCVPCILSESWHPPFHRVLAWTSSEFPVEYIHPADLPRLHDILFAKSFRTWQRKQALTLPLAAILDQRTDTFYEGLMAELAAVARERGNEDKAPVPNKVNQDVLMVHEERNP